MASTQCAHLQRKSEQNLWKAGTQLAGQMKPPNCNLKEIELATVKNEMKKLKKLYDSKRQEIDAKPFLSLSVPYHSYYSIINMPD